jgi:XTP/dITP diphosphohydrolase
VTVGAEGPRLVLASANPGKLAELRALLCGLAARVVGLEGLAPIAFPDEGDDYAANAAAKARAAADALGCAAIADDSGLEVAGLDGAPGPRSARYGGPGLDDAGRVARLLGELAARPGADRSARFVCVAAVALPGSAPRIARGECLGRIALAPRGRSGFGYDPVFEVREPGFDGSRTMAELAPEEKARISHRARAVAALVPELRRLLATPGPA